MVLRALVRAPVRLLFVEVAGTIEISLGADEKRTVDDRGRKPAKIRLSFLKIATVMRVLIVSDCSGTIHGANQY